ncbi:hypothetical protein ACHAO9_009479 [Fusarium lateritium]
MVAKAGAGPEPIPFKSLDTTNLMKGIQLCLTRDAQNAAKSIASRMRSENGLQNAIYSFYRHLPQQTLFCDILPDQPAVWKYKRKGKVIHISGLAAHILMNHVKIDVKKLEMLETKETVIENRRWDPVTGVTSATLGIFSGVTESAVNIVAKPAQLLHDANASKAARSDAASTVSREGAGESNNGNAEATKDRNLALHMMTASASEVGGLLKHHSKGVFVDVPLAFAEGSRALPKLYGEDVADYGTVKDWKSGFLVSGKSLTLGIGEGLADLVMKPYEGGKKDGFVGGVTGVGKGLLGFSSKVTSGE